MRKGRKQLCEWQQLPVVTCITPPSAAAGVNRKALFNREVLWRPATPRTKQIASRVSWQLADIVAKGHRRTGGYSMTNNNNNKKWLPRYPADAQQPVMKADSWGSCCPADHASKSFLHSLQQDEQEVLNQQLHQSVHRSSSENVKPPRNPFILLLWYQDNWLKAVHNNSVHEWLTIITIYLLTTLSVQCSKDPTF